MKKLQKSQVGGGAFGTIVTIAVLGFGVWAAIQYVPQWIESSTVDSILEKMQTENKSTPANNVAQVKKNCEPWDMNCRPKQRQALLHWAYDSRNI